MVKVRGPGRPLTMLQKIGWGFLFALLSMVAAALVEEHRLNHSPPQAWSVNTCDFFCLILPFPSLFYSIFALIVDMLTYIISIVCSRYADASARANISPCHNIDDYNPARYQQWEANTVICDSHDILHICVQLLLTLHYKIITTAAASAKGNVDEQPSECYTLPDCDAVPAYYYDASTGTNMLNVTCIACEDIPQMSGVSVFWQV